MSKSLTVMCASALLLGSACGPPQGARGERTRASQPTAGSASTEASVGVGALYWAGSDSNEVWLIYLDSGSGTIYRPIRSLALCDVRGDSTGAVTFRSAEMTDGTVYEFTGRASRDDLVGTLGRVSTRSGAVVKTSALAARQIRTRYPVGGADPISGRYDGVRVSERSGDAYGLEVVVVDGVDSIVGLWVRYEGGALPARALTANRVGDTLHLSWHSPERVGVDTVVIHGDTIKFRDRLRLVKRMSLFQVVHDPNRRECR